MLIEGIGGEGGLAKHHDINTIRISIALIHYFLHADADRQGGIRRKSPVLAIDVLPCPLPSLLIGIELPDRSGLVEMELADMATLTTVASNPKQSSSNTSDREAELARREAELAKKEAELAEREKALSSTRKVSPMQLARRELIGNSAITDDDLRKAIGTELKASTLRQLRSGVAEFVRLAKEAGRWKD